MDLGSPLSKYAIVGTAPSWALTPWHDTTLHIASLNDAYQIDGFERAEEWVDLHPLNHFFYPEQGPDGQRRTVYAHQIPTDAYVRPSHHLNWLASQTMPVWLSPNHAAECPESATWPSARAFPKAAIEAHYGRYFTSTPAWMLAHALLRGATEVHIYGIHLSTESEYIEQRPNFEYLIGMLLGTGKRTMTVHQGLRRYESPNGVIVLPEASPVLSSNFQYAFETSPRRGLEPIKWELHKAAVKRDRRLEVLKKANPWKPWVTLEEPNSEGVIVKNRMLTSSLQEQVLYFDALVADWQDQLARAQRGAMV